MVVPRRTSRSRFTLVLLILTSLTLLTLDYHGFRPIDSVRSGVLGVFSPVGDMAGGFFRPVGDAWSGAFNGADLRRENEDLRRQVEDLQGTVAQDKGAADELERIKELEGLSFIGEHETVKARVVTGAISNFDDTIDLDKGSSSGIETGMAVVNGAGLIGSVINVSDGRSTVRLITNRQMQVGVRVADRPSLGVVQGQDDEVRLKASQFDIRADLNDGDLLKTSGVSSSLFPRDIPVGNVEKVASDETTLQKTADVKLIANLTDLTYVAVVIYRPPADALR